MDHQTDLPIARNEIDELKAVIAHGETLEVEFKSDHKGSFSDAQVYEPVVALANSSGGILLIGVTDEKEIKGSTRFAEGYWKSPEAVAGMILANTVPPCATAVSVADLGGEKPVLVIRVQKSPTTTGTKSGKFLKRVIDSKGKPQNIPMTSDDILSGVTRIGVQDFSATILPDLNVDDLDLDLVSETAKRRSTQITEPHRKELFLKSPREILSSVGLLSLQEAKPSIAALLLFGKTERLRNRLPNHEIQFQVFGAKGEILKNVSFNGPIASVFPRILEFPELLRNSDEFRFRGSNVVIPEYPEDSRREAVANAIVHRDYTLPAGIQLQLFERELIITNPGGFLPGVTLQNLLTVGPTPRNRRLAEAMREFGFVESSGRGIDFIFQGQARFGRPAPDYHGSDNYRVSVRLAGGKANLDFCRFVLSSADNPGVLELLILNALFFKRKMILDQVADIIQRPPSITHEILSKLKEEKLIEITSERTPSYLLKGSANHNAMKAVKPVRLTNQQIHDFKMDLSGELQRESPNTLSTLADRVGLSPSQARRLLYQLQSDGCVTVLPSKKWRFLKTFKAVK